MENPNLSSEQNLDTFLGPSTPVPSLPSEQDTTIQQVEGSQEEIHAGKILASVQQRKKLRYFYGGKMIRQMDACETFPVWIPATWNKNVNCNVGLQKWPDPHICMLVAMHIVDVAFRLKKVFDNRFKIKWLFNFVIPSCVLNEDVYILKGGCVTKLDVPWLAREGVFKFIYSPV